MLFYVKLGKGVDVMLSYQYHEVLKTVAEMTFPNHKILPFKIEIYAKESKTRHGDYNSANRIIRIFNLSQKVDYTIATALHELAHHCEFSIYNSTGHSKRFYKVFKGILESAISLGIIEYENIRYQENANDIQMLEKHLGPVSFIAKPTTMADRIVLKVLNSFDCRTHLKERNYFYDGIEKAWGKILFTKELSTEIEFLLQYVNKSDLITRSLYDLSFEAIYYLFIPNGYEKREVLKQNGYFYKQWRKHKGWAKKIVSTDLEKEKQLLVQLKIDNFAVTNSLK